jgi:hypothetical protein
LVILIRIGNGWDCYVGLKVVGGTARMPERNTNNGKRSLGLDDDSDKVFDAYYEIIERRSRKIDADSETIMKQALKAYVELMQLKKSFEVKGE